MIPPEDLKNKNFSRTVRGYNPIEVDDYILFLLTKYEQLYAENAELEKRLHIVSGKYEELASDEESIRKAVGQAQKLSESMIRAAEKSASEIVSRVTARCEDLIQDAQIKVEAEQIKLARLRLDAAKFKEMLTNEYTKYLKLLRATDIPSPEDAEKEFPSGSQIFSTAMDEIEPSEILESSVLSVAADPELEEFKRFVRPKKKRLSREEKDAIKRARKEGRVFDGNLTDMVLESIVDAEDAQDTAEEQLLAESPEMSVEEAVSTSAPKEEAPLDSTMVDQENSTIES